MRRLFYFMLFIIPVGRLVSASLFESASKVASLTPDEIVLCLLLVVYLFECSRSGKSSFQKLHVGKPILFFIAWGLFSLVVGKIRYDLTIAQTAFSALYLARWTGYCALFYITYDLCRTSADLRRIVKWLVAGAMLFSVFGLIQAAFLPDFAFVLHPDAIPSVDFDLQGHRLVSTFLDPNIAAGYILIFTLLALSFWIHGHTRWLGAFLLFGAALFATLSRGAVLGLAIGIVVLLARKGFPWKRAMWGMLAFSCLVYFMYPILKEQIQDANRIALSDPSALSRIQDWAIAVEIVVANPIMGIGFDTLGYVLPHFGIIRESATAFAISGDLITIVVLTGIVGLALYLWIYVDIIQGLSRLCHGSTSNWVHAYARGVQSATVAVLVSSFFTTLLLYPQIMAVLWTLWALGARLEDGVAARAPQRSPVLAHAPA